LYHLGPFPNVEILGRAEGKVRGEVKDKVDRNWSSSSALSLTFVDKGGGFLRKFRLMARLNSKWLDVALGCGIGAAAAWHVRSILAAGKWDISDRVGWYAVSSPDRAPFFYWLWVAIWAGIALLCFGRAAWALIDIVRLHRMDRRAKQD
jgi:hypothetical protein